VLGYLPQDFGVYPGETAEAMLRHIAALKGIPGRAEREHQVEARLRATNLWEHRRRKLGTFSGGMRQRFGIAQALLGDPQLLIVDEPTAGLDPAERIRFHNLLAAISQEVIVILSTHLVEDVASLCARMAILVAGSVVLQGEPERTVAKLDGQVWEGVIRPGEPVAPPAGTQLLSTHLRTGRTITRVHSAGRPGVGYSPVPATLEDVYFAALAAAPGAGRAALPAAAAGV
jgi:ABC-type multidrug transport system ATPase subunit